MGLTPSHRLLFKALPIRLIALVITIAGVLISAELSAEVMGVFLLLFITVLSTPFIQKGIRLRVKEEISISYSVLGGASLLAWCLIFAVAVLARENMTVAGDVLGAGGFFTALLLCVVFALCMGQIAEGIFFSVRSAKNQSPPGSINRCIYITATALGAMLGFVIGGSGWLL